MTKTYRVTKEFKGSITGSDVVLFNEGQLVDEAIMGGDLLGVAINERWVKALTNKELTAMEADADIKITGVEAYIQAQK